ncbi:MAG: rhamnulokinase, partial [Clostridia bacterium]|nr:rhamnulokinase [Clostridia bacterium]
MHPLHMLGFDYGASSGRAMHGAFDGKRLAIQEVHRFSNDPVMVGRTLYWDVLRLLIEMRNGLSKAVRSTNTPVTVGIDTWG